MEVIDFEPKKNNRCIVKFPSKYNIQEYVITEINKPKFINGKWDDFKIKFRNIISPSPEHGVYQMVNELPLDGLLFNFVIQDLDPTGVIVGEWVIGVSEVIYANFGLFSFDNYENQNIELVLRPKFCHNKF
jgi:hypothetical protein